MHEAMKFCFLFGEKAVMLETADKEAALGKNKTLRVVFPLRGHFTISLAQGDPRPPELLKTWPELVD